MLFWAVACSMGCSVSRGVGCDVSCGVGCGVSRGVSCDVGCGVTCDVGCGVVCGVSCGVNCGVDCGLRCSELVSGGGKTSKGETARCGNSSSSNGLSGRLNGVVNCSQSWRRSSSIFCSGGLWTAGVAITTAGVCPVGSVSLVMVCGGNVGFLM